MSEGTKGVEYGNLVEMVEAKKKRMGESLTDENATRMVAAVLIEIWGEVFMARAMLEGINIQTQRMAEGLMTRH